MCAKATNSAGVVDPGGVGGRAGGVGGRNGWFGGITGGVCSRTGGVFARNSGVGGRLGGFQGRFLRSIVLFSAGRGRAVIEAFMRARRDTKVLRCIGRVVQ